jgi:exopolyphosphatase / guanosine-5'-triphosphate,3'-diphosphate pyrophosphatase
MITASIDIGTNTVLLLVADVTDGIVTRVLHDEQLIARLGRGVDADRTLLHETMERAAGFLRRYKQTAEALHSERIVAVGTSALRDAANGREFCSYIAATTGIEIEILSGDDEARWTYRGGISEFKDRAESFSVLDIGGGSTEVIVGTEQTIKSKRSFDAGCVRMTERYLLSSPPTDEELAQARSAIADMLHPVRAFDIASTLGVAVAGTATTLAALYQRLPEYDPSRVSGFRLSRQIVQELFDELQGMTSAQITALPQVSEGRADVLLAGVLILMEYLELSGLEAVLVSDRGLRYGILERG